MTGSPLGQYQSLIDSGHFEADTPQAEAVTALDRLWHDLADTAPQGFLTRVLGRKPPGIRGIYLWGGVGRGKTWLMDLFYESVPFAEKQRIHFHRFMARVHAGLRERSHQKDPLTSLAREWSQRCRLLCFDEFHVSDIADAMLLAGLLQTLFNEGVVLVATSNLHPDELYRDGLQRARFIPAIELLHQHTQVIHVEGETDFRLRILERSEIYHCPHDDAAEASLTERFAALGGGVSLPAELKVNGRVIKARRRADGVIWFDFHALCEQPRSTSDYIEISKAFNTVLVSGLPAMDDRHNDAARRFVNLVDEFYDRNVKLLITAATPMEQIYTGDRLSFEFQRTTSRLVEMQSHEYLARPHLP
ncbi:MAG: cell division protein ZapE [Xanthomonadales bacterium]|nr:cell division protein ZapE [Xanthomonadales bacterium]